MGHGLGAASWGPGGTKKKHQSIGSCPKAELLREHRTKPWTPTPAVGPTQSSLLWVLSIWLCMATYFGICKTCKELKKKSLNEKKNIFSKMLINCCKLQIITFLYSDTHITKIWIMSKLFSLIKNVLSIWFFSHSGKFNYLFFLR